MTGKDGKHKLGQEMEEKVSSFLASVGTLYNVTRFLAVKEK